MLFDVIQFDENPDNLSEFRKLEINLFQKMDEDTITASFRLLNYKNEETTFYLDGTDELKELANFILRRIKNIKVT